MPNYGLDAWIHTGMPGMRALSVSEDNGVTWEVLTLPSTVASSMSTEDAFLWWESQYAAWSPSGGTIAIEYEWSTDRVIIYMTPATDIKFESESLATHLGFSSVQPTSTTHSWVSDLPPAAFHPGRVGRGALVPAETVDLKAGRMGPKWAEAWSNGSVFDVRFTMSAAEWQAKSTGPLFSGRMTVHTQEGGAASTRVGDVLKAKVEPAGAGPGYWNVTLTLGDRS